MISVCYGHAVSDRCSQGSVKDLSGENLLQLIETGQLYDIFHIFVVLSNFLIFDFF